MNPTTQLEVYRRMTPAERVAVGCALHDFAFQRMVLHLQRQHPEKSEREIKILARGQLNILHTESGTKVELILRKLTDFAREEFARKRPVSFSPERDAFAASPEDVILSKLLYYREGKSQKHLTDISGILKVEGHRLDRANIERWVRELHLESAWAEVHA